MDKYIVRWTNEYGTFGDIRMSLDIACMMVKTIYSLKPGSGYGDVLSVEVILEEGEI